MCVSVCVGARGTIVRRVAENYRSLQPATTLALRLLISPVQRSEPGEVCSHACMILAPHPVIHSSVCPNARIACKNALPQPLPFLRVTSLPPPLLCGSQAAATTGPPLQAARPDNMIHEAAIPMNTVYQVPRTVKDLTRIGHTVGASTTARISTQCQGEAKHQQDAM